MMNSPDQSETSKTSWIKIVKKYNRPSSIKSWWQLAVNLFLYSLAWFLMYESLTISWWITFAISIPAAGLLVRLFIIYHDCGHGSFFRSQWLNDATGLFIGVITFTPYYSWTDQHRIHHDTAGNLDKRGTGDVWTMTVKEYRTSSRWKRIQYNFYRHPVTMFGIGAFWVFVIGNRFTKKYMDRKGRIGVYVTNVSLVLFAAAMSLLIGFKAFLLIQMPVITIAGIFGFWLFYVQHQFDDTYWSRGKEWDYQRTALEGSSFYKLPRILQYFSGNIGYHHIHHLSPLIPNYKLSSCHRENQLFCTVKPLTFRKSFRTLRFRLWDEASQRMVSFSSVKAKFIIFLMLAAGLTAHSQNLPKVVYGSISRTDSFPSKFVTARNIDVWLPEGYTPDKKYAVLYMHDGQMLYDSSATWNKLSWDVDNVADSLMKAGKTRNFIVVGIWNGGISRHSDYFPQEPFESLTKEKQEAAYAAARTNGVSVFGNYRINSDNYLKFLVTELKPYIDGKYSTLGDRKNTFVAGSSMGGLISMYAICEYPDVFGGAACMSTHWPGIFSMEGNPIPDAFLNYLNTHLPDPKTHKIYFDYGDQKLDAMYPPLQKKADDVIKRRGYTKKNWETRFFPGKSHSETAWHERLCVPLEFLLTK